MSQMSCVFLRLLICHYLVILTCQIVAGVTGQTLETQQEVPLSRYSHFLVK